MDLDDSSLTYTVLPTTSLTCLACTWLFFKYLRESQKNSGFSMVIILAISDFIYSSTLFANYFFPEKIGGTMYYIALLSTLYFSMYWAGAIAFFAFQTVKNKNAISNQSLLKGLAIALSFASFSGFSWYQRLSYYPIVEIPDLILYAPPALALLFTSVFYWKSIKTLRSQPECELKSIKLYIRNLKYHSISQIVTCGPIIMTFAAISAFGRAEVRTPPLLGYFALVAQTLSCLSGFMNALLYLKHGKVKNNDDLMEYMNADLTNDTMC